MKLYDTHQASFLYLDYCTKPYTTLYTAYKHPSEQKTSLYSHLESIANLLSPHNLTLLRHSSQSYTAAYISDRSTFTIVNSTDCIKQTFLIRDLINHLYVNGVIFRQPTASPPACGHNTTL